MLASISGARGSLEERDRQIERSGMYGEYPAIVRAYEELFADPESSIEAVKRALFLVWRGAMESPANTGIAPLPDGTVRSVIDELAARVRRDECDEELLWMIAWYHAQSPFLFDLYGATPELVRAAESREPDAWRETGFTAASMTTRGQMGRYWVGLKQGAV